MFGRSRISVTLPPPPDPIPGSHGRTARPKAGRPFIAAPDATQHRVINSLSVSDPFPQGVHGRRVPRSACLSSSGCISPDNEKVGRTDTDVYCYLRIATMTDTHGYNGIRATTCRYMTTPLHVRVSDETLATLRTLATAERRKIAALIALLIDEALEARSRQPDPIPAE